MIVKGIWKGQYKYDNKVHQKHKGVDATNFEINITTVDNNHFSGTVEDDLITGGTEGIGEITGVVTGKLVEFIKQMPVKTILNPHTGERKTYNKKHPKIYYTGMMSEDGKSITGKWKFKPGVIVLAIMLLFGVKNSGTWTMTLCE